MNFIIYADLRLKNFSEISPSAARQLVRSVVNSLRGAVNVESVTSLRNPRVSVFVQNPVVYDKSHEVWRTVSRSEFRGNKKTYIDA
jgi:hypothetical protein